MNTQKQILLIVVLTFMFVGACAAYTAVDLPHRAIIQDEYQYEQGVERGALLFANNCRTCHGNKGQGGVGLPLNIDQYKDQDPLVLKANQDKIRRTLFCGRAGTLMQPWLNTNGGSLNAVQIDHLVQLVTSPIAEDKKDEEGNVTSKGWTEAVEFAHNLNREGSGVVGGDTLDTIAKAHRIGPAELAKFNDREVLGLLKKDSTVKLPPAKGRPNGATYKVLNKNETITKVAEKTHVGAAIVAELNGLNYKIDGKRNTIAMLNEKNETIAGFFPGDKVKLPESASYTVLPGDTLDKIAAPRGLRAADIKSLNDSVRNLGAAEEIKLEPDKALVLKLPKVDAYVVQGQALEDVAKAYGNATADDFAKANGAPNGKSLLRIGTALKLPPEIWGAAPAGAPNPGTACIENAVPRSVFETITGASKDPDKPAAPSNKVVIEANANDWTLTADGTKQAANKGVTLLSKGSTIEFTNVVGLHTISINGKKDGADFKSGEKRTITFGESGGPFKITCDYHPDMKAFVYVQ